MKKLISLLFLAGTVFAQSGILDPSFNGNGIVRPYPLDYFYNIQYTYPNAITQLGSGKILVSGTWNASPGTPFLFQFNEDGSTDNTFADHGFSVGPSISSTYDHSTMKGHIIQNNGKIIVGGTMGDTTIYNSEIYLNRFYPNGQLDSSFGVNGELTTNISPNTECAIAMLDQNDGKMLVLGGIKNSFGDYEDALIGRFNEDGIPDSTFDSDGYKIISFAAGPGNARCGYSYYDHKLLVAGRMNWGADDKTVIYKLLPDGQIDNSFNSDGYAYVDLGFTFEEVQEMQVTMDGHIFLLIRTTISTLPYIIHPYVAKLTPNGDLDSSFATNGILHLDLIPTKLELISAVLDLNEHLIITGFAPYDPNPNTDHDVVLVSLNMNGSFDTTFNNTGIVFQNIQDNTETALVVNIQADNKILVGGYINYWGGEEMMLLRYQNVPWTGLDPVEHESIIVYPNPVKDILRLSTVFDRAFLFEINGKMVLTSFSPGNSMDLSGVADGIYFFQCEIGSTLYRKKIIKTSN
jgi:uncharacterized delta-60 repeat protein